MRIGATSIRQVVRRAVAGPPHRQILRFEVLILRHRYGTAWEQRRGRAVATMDQYVDIATACYGTPSDPKPPPNGFTVQKWEWATWYGNGYQGGIFASPTEVIVGLSGTGGGAAAVSQVSGDIRIGVNVIPNMAGSAFAMVGWAKQNFKTVPISIVGHSLGGGLAQVVGNWAGLPFISFNGPGMVSHLKMSAFNIFKPMQMLRSATAKNTSDSVGICFTIKGDLVGEFGYHVGYEVVLPRLNANMSAHGLWAVSAGINTKGLSASQPRDILSIWPK
jgi:hypothetical protein